MPYGVASTTDGISYRFDFDARTVTVEDTPPEYEVLAETRARKYQRILDAGTENPQLSGPQVDFLGGLTDSWEGDTENALAIMLDENEPLDQWETDTPREGWGQRRPLLSDEPKTLTEFPHS